MIWALTLIYVLVVIVMILAILIQQPRRGGLSATFGGTQSIESILGVREAPTFFAKLTAVLGTIYLVLSLSISLLQGNVRGGKTAIERAFEKAQQTQQLNLPPVIPPEGGE